MASETTTTTGAATSSSGRARSSSSVSDDGHGFSLSNNQLLQAVVRVTGHRKAGTFLRSYDVFVIQMRLRDRQWCLYRRYSHLYELNQQLRGNKAFETSYRAFPPKGGLRDLFHTQEFLDERCSELNQWVQSVRKTLRKLPAGSTLPGWWSELVCGTPILDAADRGDLDALSGLIERGEASPFDCNHDYLTPLHCAAIKGHAHVIEFLLRLQVAPDPNAVNYRGHTPLLAALDAGPAAAAAADMLIQLDADLAIVEAAGSGHSALHVAAGFSLSLVKKLLAGCPRLLNQPNREGQTALDCARGKAGTHEVLLYLESVGALSGAELRSRAADVRSRVDELEGLMNRASERDDHKLVAEILIQIGDLLADDDLCQAAKIYNTALAVLDAHESLADDRPGVARLVGDKLAALQERLLRRYLSPVRQGMQHAVSEAPSSTAALLASGDAIIRQRSERRARLRELRTQLLAALQRPSTSLDVRGSLGQMSDGFAQLLSSIVQHAVTASTCATQAHGPDGRPLFAVVLLGELATRDASPYPRVQFVIMTQRPSFAITDFCRLLVQLINLAVINLGETECLILNHRTVSQISTGFCLDYNGLVPDLLGEQPNLLIGTPWHFAQLHLPTHFSANPARATALLNTALLYGANSLLELYRQEYPSLLAQQSTTGTGMLVRQKRALTEIAKWVQALKLKGFWGTKEKVKEWFELNKEVVEFIYNAVLALSYFHGGRTVDIWRRIEELCDKGILMFEAARNLKLAYSNIMHVRCIAQLHTKSRCDIVYNSFAAENVLPSDAGEAPPRLESEPQDPETLDDASSGHAASSSSAASSSTAASPSAPAAAAASVAATAVTVQMAYHLTRQDVDRLVDIFNTAICLHKAFDYFDQVKGKVKSADLGTMRSEQPEVVGEAYFRLCLYKRAMEILEDAVAKHPRDTHLVGYVGMIWSKLGKFHKAIEYYTRALDMEKKTLGEFHNTIAARYNNIAVAWKHLGEQEKAVENLERALVVDEKHYGKNHPIIAFDHRQLGKTWKGMGNLERSLDYFEKTLQIDTQVARGEANPAIIDDHHEIAQVLSQLNQHERALRHYEQAVELARTVYGGSAQNVAIRLTALAAAYKRLERKEDSLRCNQEAYAINQKAYGDAHHLVARDLANIGESYALLGQLPVAAQHFRQALTMLDGLQFDPNHQRYVRIKKRLEQIEKLDESQDQISDADYNQRASEITTLQSQQITARADAAAGSDSETDVMDFVAAARNRKPTRTITFATGDNDSILDDSTFDL